MEAGKVQRIVRRHHTKRNISHLSLFVQFVPRPLQLDDEADLLRGGVFEADRLAGEVRLERLVLGLEVVDLGEQGLEEGHALQQEGLVHRLRGRGHQGLQFVLRVRDLLFLKRKWKKKEREIPKLRAL